MKSTIILVVLLSLAGGVHSQTPPVSVVKTSSFVPSSQCTYGYEKCFSVTYKNVADKDIVAVEFNVVFVDKMGDKHTYAHSFYAEHRHLKPGKDAHSVWDNLLYDYCRKYEVTAKKVAFSDGTVWPAPSVTEASQSQTNLGDKK